MYYIMYVTMSSYMATIHPCQRRDAKKGVSCSRSAPGQKWLVGQQPRVTKTSRQYQSESDYSDLRVIST